MTFMSTVSTWMSSILPMIGCHFHTKIIVFQTWMHFIYPHSPISIYMHYTCTLWEPTPQRQTSMGGDGGETKECTLDVLNIDRGGYQWACFNEQFKDTIIKSLCLNLYGWSPFLAPSCYAWCIVTCQLHHNS
jgi:hypothetical protein